MKRMKLTAKVRKKINQRLGKLSPYYSRFSLHDIKNLLGEFWIVMVQEDGYEFEGIFLGTSGRATIELANLNTGVGDISGKIRYNAYDNTLLVLEWHQVRMNEKWEINTYLS